MKSVFVASLAAGTSAFDLAGPAITQAKVDQINSQKLSWTAGMNARFANMTMGQVAKLLGAKRDTKEAEEAKRRNLGKWDLQELPKEALPASFDVRAAFPWAANITSVVRDQSACGSCWAFGSTETFNDRLAIAKNYTSLLSAADTNAGCDGGFTSDAWGYFQRVGLVTGAGFETVGDGKSCYPYPFEICDHHEPNPDHPTCPANEFSTPACPAACPNTGYPTSWAADKHKAATSYSLPSVVAAQTDMIARGTVTVDFQVCDDFPTYKTGVYTCAPGCNVLGGHAVSFIGFGTDQASGKDYWLVRNSWNNGWGDNGLFKISRGTDECGIEDDMIGGTV